MKGSKRVTFLAIGYLSDRPKTDYCQLAVVMCTLCSTTLYTLRMRVDSLSAREMDHTGTIVILQSGSQDVDRPFGFIMDH